MSLWLFDFDNLAIFNLRCVLIDAYAVITWIIPLAPIWVADIVLLYDRIHYIVRGWIALLHRYDKCLFGRVTLIDRYNHGKIRVAIGFLKPRKAVR